MKKLGFLSFGFWQPHVAGVQSVKESYEQSVDLAVEAEKMGMDGAWYRVHHFAKQSASPFPLLSAIGQRTSKIEIGTAIIDMRYENPYMMAENAGITDILTQNRIQLGVGRGAPEQVQDGWKYFGYDYSEEEIKEIARERTLEFLKLVKGPHFAEPNPQPMFPQAPGLLSLEPYSEGLSQRIWWGAGSQSTAIWAAKMGMNLQSSTLVTYESKEPFHIQQANQLRAYKEAWKKAGHNFEPRTLVTRSILPISNDLERRILVGSEQSQDEVGYLAHHQNPTIFGRTYVGEPEDLVKDLQEDEAIREADTVLLTIPSTLGVEFNVHMLETIVKDMAPDLGWR